MNFLTYSYGELVGLFSYTVYTAHSIIRYLGYTNSIVTIVH